MNDEVQALKKELACLKAEYAEFAYIVSHDLSAPFRHISGFAKFIEQAHSDNFDETTQKHLEFIIQSSTNGAKLVQNLLRYSRLNTTTQTFSLVDLNSVIAKVKNRLADMLNVSGAEISCPSLPNIIGEEKQLTQLFYELLHNAVLYQAENNQPRITINAQTQADHWRFSIEDNGIGITPGMEEKIFKVLRRGVDGQDYPGDGMGLTLAKKIVSLHGGELWLETSTMNGTKFCFTIDKRKAVEFLSHA